MRSDFISLGDFTFDMVTSELKCGDQTKKLEPLAASFLSVLIEHAGEVVTREQLLETVWNNRIVSDDSIRKVVKRLRDAFGDDAKNPRYIKTLPLQGYCLIADLAKSRDSHSKLKLIAAGLVLIVLFISLVVFKQQPDIGRPNGAPGIPEVVISPLTSLSGSEVSGDYNAHLNRLIFLYRNNSDEPWQLFTKNLNNNLVERLTWGDHSYGRVTFSPRGDKVAFVRSEQNRETSYIADYDPNNGLLTPSELRIDGMNAHILSWSHDGKSVYLTGQKNDLTAHTLFKMDVGSMEPLQLTYPNVEGYGDYYAKESPDGKYLALFRNVSDRTYALLILELASMKLIRHQPLAFYPSALVWLGNENEIAISSFKGDFYYYSMQGDKLEEQAGSHPGLNDVFYTCGEACFYMRRHKMNYSEIVELPNPFDNSTPKPTLHKESQNAEFNPTYDPTGDTLFYTSKSDEVGYLYRHGKGQQPEILYRFNPRHVLTDISVNPQNTLLVGKLENRVFLLDLTLPLESEKAFRFITTALETVSNPTWNKTGDGIYFSRVEQHIPVLLKYDLTTDKLFRQESGLIQRQDLSDGRVFVLNNKKELFMQDSQGNRNFIANLPYYRSNFWQIHGEFLYYSSIDNNHFYLNRVNLSNGDHDIKLLYEYAWQGGFKLHPSGKRLITTHSIPASSDLVKVIWPNPVSNH